MAREVIPWDELLSFEEFDDVESDYGPHTQAVVNCFETLDYIAWFNAVGSDAPEGHDVAGVTTWSNALAPLLDPDTEKYDVNGHLVGPVQMLDEVRNDDEYHTWFTEAREAAREFYDFTSYLPSYLDKSERSFVDRHLEEFVSNLLLEIIAADVVETTHFRQMLSWYEAGHFPCGWEGDWPDGKMRVF